MENCKFHPTVEAVTTCRECGAPMCKECAEGAFFTLENNQPLCLDCSLKEAEKDLALEKSIQKRDLILGAISFVIWIAGLMIQEWFDIGSPVISFVIMFVAAIIFSGLRVMFGGGEGEVGFFDKLKGVLIGVLIATIALPIFIIIALIGNHRGIKKASKKIQEINDALNKSN